MNRERLKHDTESLPQHHRPSGSEFLQENIHSEPTNFFFLEHFKEDVLKPLPLAGIVLFVHSVWSGDSDEHMIPPAQSWICRSPSPVVDLPIVKRMALELHMYNITQGGISGLHVDPMSRVHG